MNNHFNLAAAGGKLTGKATRSTSSSDEDSNKIEEDLPPIPTTPMPHGYKKPGRKTPELAFGSPRKRKKEKSPVKRGRPIYIDLLADEPEKNLPPKKRRSYASGNFFLQTLQRAGLFIEILKSNIKK